MRFQESEDFPVFGSRVKPKALVEESIAGIISSTNQTEQSFFF